MLNPVESRCRPAVAGKIECLREFPETRICELQGKALRTIEPLSQDLAHEGLAIDHVLQPEGGHGEIVEPIVLEKIIR